MKKYLLFLVFPLLLNSCKNNSDAEKPKTEITSEKFEKLDQLQWILGTWINQNGKEFSQETWSQESPSSFTAFSFTQVGKETVFAETMALEQKADSLLLTVATAKPEQENPVTFKLIPSENGQFTFENKNHDFPQRIIYANPAKDSLHAWIEGQVDGELRKVDFHFSRQ